MLAMLQRPSATQDTEAERDRLQAKVEADVIAERICAWVDYEMSLREFADITVDEAKVIRSNAALIAKALATPTEER
ncbi:MAG: hypothetical protein VW239_04135 [Candidatus Nanopelagicales bacterium]